MAYEKALEEAGMCCYDRNLLQRIDQIHATMREMVTTCQ